MVGAIWHFVMGRLALNVSDTEAFGGEHLSFSHIGVPGSDAFRSFGASHFDHRIEPARHHPKKLNKVLEKLKLATTGRRGSVHRGKQKQFISGKEHQQDTQDTQDTQEDLKGRWLHLETHIPPTDRPGLYQILSQLKGKATTAEGVAIQDIMRQIARKNRKKKDGEDPTENQVVPDGAMEPQHEGENMRADNKFELPSDAVAFGLDGHASPKNAKRRGAVIEAELPRRGGKLKRAVARR